MRRMPKSITERPAAAATTRAAFEASTLWRWTWFITRVSTSCASGSDASISISGSSGKTGVPSGIAHTEPRKRNDSSQRRKSSRKPPSRARASRSAAVEAQRLEVGERVLEAAGEHEVAGRGQRAEVETEDGGLAQSFAQIGLRHGELVEVDRERRDGLGAARVVVALRHGARSLVARRLMEGGSSVAPAATPEAARSRG